MVLGILTSIAACPAIIGTTEAVRQGQRQNTREEQRGRKTHLTVRLATHSFYSPRFDGASIVLRDNKLWVDVRGNSAAAAATPLHPFEGYFLPFPGGMSEVWRAAGYARGGEGMVSTISRDPPFLNWVFVDRATHEVRYGVRDEAERTGVLGPWDCTPYDRRVTFEGWEGFVAVEEEEGSGLWGLYFDRDDDALRAEGKVGRRDVRMLALEVWRKELRRDRLDAVLERRERLQAREELGSSSEETTVS